MNPILSICIPTYNRLDILRNTIASIYADLDGVCMDDFEVVISDILLNLWLLSFILTTCIII